MLDEQELRTNLKMAVLIAQKAQKNGEDITYKLGIIAGMRLALELKDGEEVA